MRYELSPNCVPLSPLPLKVGVMSPQLLWERRPCVHPPKANDAYPPYPTPSSPPLPLLFPISSLVSSPLFRNSLPQIQLGGLGITVSSHSESGRSPASKRYLVHFGLKMLLAREILRAYSRKKYVCLQSVYKQQCNVTWGGTNYAMYYHAKPFRHSLYNLLSVVILWPQVTAPTAVSL